ALFAQQAAQYTITLQTTQQATVGSTQQTVEQTANQAVFAEQRIQQPGAFTAQQTTKQVAAQQTAFTADQTTQQADQQAANHTVLTPAAAEQHTATRTNAQH